MCGKTLFYSLWTVTVWTMTSFPVLWYVHTAGLTMRYLLPGTQYQLQQTKAADNTAVCERGCCGRHVRIRARARPCNEMILCIYIHTRRDLQGVEIDRNGRWSLPKGRSDHAESHRALMLALPRHRGKGMCTIRIGKVPSCKLPKTCEKRQQCRRGAERTRDFFFDFWQVHGT